MRKFRSYLFSGNGNISEIRRKQLHERVDEALRMNSAREQGYAASPDEVQEVIDVVHDVAAALLGRRITLGSKIPYKSEPVFTGDLNAVSDDATR